MGNSYNKPESICETLDNISSNYILSMDYRALSHMSDEEYCNKFTLITQDLLDTKFNKLDIKYLTIRIKKGHKPLIDIFNNQDNDIQTYETVTNKDEVYYSDDITNDNKKQMCLNISQFYIKIGHLFAAIVTALDPVYMVDGKPYPFNTPKNKLPEHSVLTISETGICHKKIMALQFGYVSESKLNPRFCNIHSKYSSIYNYNGIPELETLYYDKIDVNGKPYMSETTRNQYTADLQLLYSQFTPKSSSNSTTETTSSDTPTTLEINNFKDISLKEYHNNINCNDNTFNTPITKSEKDNVLFIDYADNLKDMLSFSKKKEQFFLSVINEIFIKSSSDKSIIINPDLTDNRLNQLINEVRNNLLEYYIKIDEYFNNGIDIYTAIVLYRKLHKQLDNMNEMNSNVPENSNEYDNLTTPPYTIPNSPDQYDYDNEHIVGDDEDRHTSTEEEEKQEDEDKQYETESPPPPPQNTDYEKDNYNSPYKPLFNTPTPSPNENKISSVNPEESTQEDDYNAEPPEQELEEYDENGEDNEYKPEENGEDNEYKPEENGEDNEYNPEENGEDNEYEPEEDEEESDELPVENIQQQPVEPIQQQPVEPIQQQQPVLQPIILQPQPIIINPQQQQPPQPIEEPHQPQQQQQAPQQIEQPQQPQQQQQAPQQIEQPQQQPQPIEPQQQQQQPQPIEQQQQQQQQI